MRRTTCRGCRGERIEGFLDLGLQPLANSLPASPEDFADEMRFPLEVFFCHDCGLVQLADVIDPAVLFGHYLYMTGMSATMEEHNRRYARAVADARGLGGDDFVVDVASNDGSLLIEFGKLGIRTLGVEPAENLAKVARDRGVETVSVFFDAGAARDLVAERGHAAAVMANNVFAHVDDPVGFLTGLGQLAGPEGTVVVEAPYLGELLDRFEYDTVYHEHLSYFSMAALTRIYDAAGLRIDRIDRVPIHGGSLRVWGTLTEGRSGHDEEVVAAVEREKDAGLVSIETYRTFAASVREHREALRGLLTDLKARGATVAGYGAPAKGSTLLNYGDIGTDLVEFVVDRNPLKVGRYLPGVHQPILDASEVLARRPDYLLILPWNIAAEIMEQEREYREGGGRFIVPVPKPVIVGEHHD